MKKRFVPVLIFAMILSVSGCKNETKTDEAGVSETVAETPEAEVNSEQTSADMSDVFSDRDFEVGYDETESTLITFDGKNIESSSDTARVEGSVVTITDEGTYILSGNLEDGMLIVDAEDTDKIQLVLNGVTIQSSSSAAIYVRQADKVFVTTGTDTENTLSNGGEFTAIDENNIDAVIFSKDDLTLNGSGSLSIASPAGHGIVSKDSLKITSGSYEIVCSGHALDGKDDVCVANADFQIDAGKDGIHAENTDDETLGYVYIQSGEFHITAEGDGISGATDVQIVDGQFDIMTGDGSETVSIEDMQGSTTQTAGNMGQHGGITERPDGTMGQHGGYKEQTDGEMTKPEGNMERPDGTMGQHGGYMDRPEMDFSDTESESETDSVSQKGIKAGNILLIDGGTFTINSVDDAIHSNASATINEGSFEIIAGDDAIHAESTLSLTGGKINITGSYEGLEGLCVDISGGEIELVARDDGINAAGGTGDRNSDCKVVISGGTISVTAGADGIDANGSISITGGYTTVCGPTQGDTSALDYNSGCTIEGGTFIGTGASAMAQTFSDSKQGVIAVNVGNQSAETEIEILDSSNCAVLTYVPELSYGVVIFSSPDIETGKAYTMTIGSQSVTVTAN